MVSWQPLFGGNEWAKLHWNNCGYIEPHSVCFDCLEPTLAFDIEDYHLKSVLVNDLELWQNAADSGKDPVEYLKSEIISNSKSEA